MSYIANRDFLLEVAKGNVAGHSLVHKYGRNPAVPNGSWEPLTSTGILNFVTAAATVRIKAGNAADDAAGVGAQSIFINGINDSGVETTEEKATAGAAASTATTALFWRVFRAYVGDAGAYATTATTVGANTGVVTIENGTGGTDLLQIDAGAGQSEHCHYAIPAGKTAYFLGYQVTIDGKLAADVRIMTRSGLNDFTTPFSPKRERLYLSGVLGSNSDGGGVPLFSLPEYSDIWIEANGGGAATAASANFELLLVDD